MNVVDAIVLAAIVVFAWTGWRQGFVAGLLSFGGFLIGALTAALLLPRVLEGLALPDFLANRFGAVYATGRPAQALD